jgi:hypothetical protein
VATYTLDWSETNLGGSAVVSYSRAAVLDFTDKPAGATSALSLTANNGDSTNITIAEFSIETSGSSVMTFDYHVSSESGFDKLHIDVDGVSQANFSGTVAWTSHAGINIASAGTHTIRFRYQKDGSGLGGDDRAWVALLNITNTVTTNDDSSTVDLFDMEDAALPAAVTTSTWTNSTSEPIAGSRSLRSPASPANNGSYDLEITKPATTPYRAVSFEWKTSSEAGWDKLYVFPDSSAANVPASGHPSTAGSPGWLDFSGTATGRLAAILPAAESSLLLRYAKDGGGSAGSDAAWIDSLRMPVTAAVEGVAAGAFGFTGSAAGVDRAVGVAVVAFGGTFTAQGVDRAVGQAIASLGGTFAAAGIDRALGVAVATFGFTGTASGTVGTPPVTGVAVALLGFTGSSAGVDRALGVAAASFGFTGAASGVVGSAPVTGVAVAAFGFTATAAGVDQVLGVAVASLGFTSSAQGVDRAVGVALATFGYTAGATGQRRTFGVAVVSLGFTGSALGINFTLIAPAERTYVVPTESRTATVGAESRVTTVPAESRTTEV